MSKLHKKLDESCAQFNVEIWIDVHMLVSAPLLAHLAFAITFRPSACRPASLVNFSFKDQLYWNGHWVDEFQIYVRFSQSHPIWLRWSDLANIGPYGNFIQRSTPLKPLSQFEPNFSGMVIGWTSFKFVFGFPKHHPIWPPWPNLV